MRRFLTFIGGLYIAVGVGVVAWELVQRWLDAQLDQSVAGRWDQ